MLCSEKGVLPGSDYYLGADSLVNNDLHIRLLSCGSYHCVDAYEINRTYHDALLLVYVIEGKMFLKYREIDYMLNAGDAFIIDCRYPQHYGSVDRLDFLWAHINQGNSLEICEELNRLYGPVIRHENIGQVQEKLLNILSYYRNEQYPSDYVISAECFGALCHFYANDSLKERSKKNQAVSMSIEYMKYHLASDIRVSDVADAVHISKHHFSRLFKEHSGMSPHNYLIKLRLDRAKHLLTTTEMTIRDIAFEVGFKSDMGLITAFKEKLGISPGKYRTFNF